MKPFLDKDIILTDVLRRIDGVSEERDHIEQWRVVSLWGLSNEVSPASARLFYASN